MIFHVLVLKLSDTRSPWMESSPNYVSVANRKQISHNCILLLYIGSKHRRWLCREPRATSDSSELPSLYKRKTVHLLNSDALIKSHAQKEKLCECWKREKEHNTFNLLQLESAFYYPNKCEDTLERKQNFVKCCNLLCYRFPVFRINFRVKIVCLLISVLLEL